MTRQIKRLLQSELKHVSKWAYALILVIYACMVVLQLNSFPMWFCSLRENSFLGFFDRVGNVGVSAPTADRQTQAAPVLESGIAT